MPEVQLKNQINSWLKSQSLWLKHVGRHLLDGTFTDSTMQMCYQIFLHENQLKLWEGELPQVEFPDIVSSDDTGSAPLKLVKLNDVKNVNALAENQELTFSPNLTIIYGGNGSGKSSYIRLLNNAFISRGDKEILKNIFNPQTGSPSCTFTFQTTGPLTEIHYPDDKNASEFSKLSVFDSRSIRIHLEGENALNFTPSGFEFFESLVHIYAKLNGLLTQDIAAAKKPNEFVTMFNNDNSVRDFIIGLSASSKETELEKLAKFETQESNKLNELIVRRNELKAQNIAEKIRDIQSKIQKIDAVKLSFKNALTAFTEENAKLCNDLISRYNTLQILIEQNGIQSLKNYDIVNIGSKEWKQFITSARSYAESLEKNRNESYPSDSDNCILCLQPLDSNAIQLLESYWTLLKSEAEKEAKQVGEELSRVQKNLSELNIPRFDETHAAFEIISTFDIGIFEKWKNVSKRCIENKKRLIDNITQKLTSPQIEFSIESEIEFDEIIERLSSQLVQLTEHDTQTELVQIDLQIQLLTDKQILNAIKEKVSIVIQSYKWAKLAEKAASAFRTNTITAKQGELFGQHVSTKYLDVFKEECLALNAPMFVSISQRNSKAATLRQLKIVSHASSSFANKVLSEGEQRAISFADFLTELRLNPNNTGIILDDPTTSLDHERRDLIAKRFALLSKEKQVIVFTHDIVFMNRLRTDSELLGIKPSVYTLRRSSDLIGVANLNLPWQAQKVKDRVGALKQMLVDIKKIETAGNEDEYLLRVKSWYELLREGWERAVEERLFKGVLERFSPSVQTQKLKGVVITSELVKKIELGMTDSSAMIHDMSAAINSKPPTHTQATASLKSLEEFIAECQPA